MSTSPESDFDLEKLFLPAWAQESPTVNKYAKFAGEDRRDSDDRRDRPGGRRPPPRRDFSGPRGGRDQGPPRKQGGGFDANRGRPQRGGTDRFQRPARDEQREPVAPPLEINITLLPDETGVDGLARQIKMTGRAYPLFQIAQLVLQKPERYLVKFDTIKKPDGQIAQQLFLCALDDTLWLSQEEAIAHVLQRQFQTFYQPEKTQIDPPKGTYTFVAQCGMSGAILGPPNYHDYQNQLRKLHTERFSRIPYDVFKSRVKIVKDEAVVKKWLEDQSSTTEYVCLNVPEAKRLKNREEVEKHFRETHLTNIIEAVQTYKMSGVASRQLRSPQLQRAVREAWEEQRRFPLRLATTLSQQFASRGLQFFKVNRTVTHVSVARPNFLDLETTPVSDGVRRIVDFINASPKCTRRKLIETFAPNANAPKAGEAVAAVEATPEQMALIADLHWLIHQGHVIEFANGILETAKKPLPRPPKPEPKKGAPVEVEPAAETAELTSAEAAASGEQVESASAAETNGSNDEAQPAVAATESVSTPAETPAAGG